MTRIKGTSVVWLLLIAIQIGCSVPAPDTASYDPPAHQASSELQSPSATAGVSAKTHTTQAQEDARGIKKTSEAFDLTDAPKRTSVEPPGMPSRTGKKRAEFTVQLGHLTGLVSAVMTADQQFVVSASRTEVKIWDWKNGRLIRTIPASYFLTSPDGRSGTFFDGEKGSKQAVSLLDVFSQKSSPLFNVEVERGYAGRLEFYSYAMSIDGMRILINGIVYDAVTGNQAFRLEGADDTAIFSNDGRFILGGTDSGVKIWDAQTGDTVRILEGTQRGWVRSVSVSPDGRLVASGERTGTVRLWDLSSGKAMPVCSVRKDIGPMVAFSPDGRLIASGGQPLSDFIIPGSSRETIVLWDVSSGKLIQELGKHKRLVSLRFSPDGNYLLSCGDTSVKIWHLRTGKEISNLGGFKNSGVSVAAFSPTGETMLLGADNANNKLLIINSGEVRRRYQEPKGEPLYLDGQEPPDTRVHCLVFDKNAKNVLVGGGDFIDGSSFLHLMDFESGAIVRSFATTQGFCTISAAFSTDGNRAFSIGGFHEIASWDVETGGEITRFRTDDTLFPGGFVPDGKAFLSWATDETRKEGHLRLSRTVDAQVIWSLDEFISRPRAAAFFLNGSRVLVGSVDGKIALIDVEKGTSVREYGAEGSMDPDDVLQAREDGQYFAVSLRSLNTTAVYDLASGHKLRTVPGRLLGLAPTGAPVVATRHDGRIELWDALSGSFLYSTVLDTVQGDYLTWLSEGYYRGSGIAVRQMVHLVHGMETFSIDQFFDRFYNPAMIQAKVLDYKVDAPRLAEVLQSSPPPYAEIVSPRMGGGWEASRGRW